MDWTKTTTRRDEKHVFAVGVIILKVWLYIENCHDTNTKSALLYNPTTFIYALQWRHNEHNGFSNQQPHDCLLSRLFRRRSKNTSKLRVTALYEGNSPVTGEFPAQRDGERGKCFHFDDFIMAWHLCSICSKNNVLMSSNGTLSLFNATSVD